MRTQIAKTAHLPAEYIPPTFWLVHPLPLLRRLTVGAAIEKNFFLFFFVTSFLFGFILDFIQNIFRFNSLQVFSRYSSSDFSLCIIQSDFHVEFTSSRLRFSTMIIILDSVFSILYFDSFLLVEFYSHQFRLVSALFILRFNSSTLYLFCLL